MSKTENNSSLEPTKKENLEEVDALILKLQEERAEGGYKINDPAVLVIVDALFERNLIHEEQPLVNKKLFPSDAEFTDAIRCAQIMEGIEWMEKRYEAIKPTKKSA